MRGTASSSASRPVCRRGAVSSHRVRRHYDTARTRHRTATLRPQYKWANDPWQPVSPASTVRQQQYLGRRARMSRHNAQFTSLCNAAVVLRSHSYERVCCRYLRLNRWCSSQRGGHPALSPRSQTSLANCCVFVFRSPSTIRHQRLQPLNSSFRFPHSLCNAVDGQHSPRKQRTDSIRHSRHKDIYLCVIFIMIV